MANLKAEFHEHLTRPRSVKYNEEMNICLLESRLEMSPGDINQWKSIIDCNQYNQ